jgi:hypothetical protein
MASPAGQNDFIGGPTMLARIGVMKAIKQIT